MWKCCDCPGSIYITVYESVWNLNGACGNVVIIKGAFSYEIIRNEVCGKVNVIIQHAGSIQNMKM